MPYFRNIFPLLIGVAFLTSFPGLAYGQIDSYQVNLGYGHYQGRDLIILRSYQLNHSRYYVGIDVDDLSSHILSASSFKFMASGWEAMDRQYGNRTYFRALLAAKRSEGLLQDAGLQQGDIHENGFVLSVDLCPSHKPLDRDIFSSIISGQKDHHPASVSISITGIFLKTHLKDVLWLKSLQDSGLLNINWVNHTYHHHYDPKLPLSSNFLLEPHTDFKEEVLALEQALLEQGLVMSAFFRFPGLVSDALLVEKLLSYGLIPIGSDAWLAKGQPISDGAIVLIHGNGNEPVGVTDFIHYYSKRAPNKLHLVDLKESIVRAYPAVD